MSRANEITDRIIEEIERTGSLPWRRPWRCQAPRNGLSGRPYRGGNRLRLALEPRSDPRWLTYLQAQRLGANVRRDGQIAYYVPSRDQVVVPPLASFESKSAHYGTLFHELVHSTGHASRLARAGVTETVEYGSSAYAKEELVAELGAAFLLAEAGLTPDLPNTAAYVQGWLGALRKDRTLVPRAASAAQLAVDWITGESGVLRG